VTAACPGCLRTGVTPRPPAVGRWDWRVLGRRRPIAARLVAAGALAGVAWCEGPPGVLPALAAVPLGELLVAWHGGQARHGFAVYDDPLLVARHLRALGRRALLALIAPLLIATALLATEAGLPATLPLAHTTADRAAAGVLCAGGYGLVLLLAAVRRLRVALVLVLAGLGGPVPLLCGYLTGLVLAALALFDPRTFRTGYVRPAPAERYPRRRGRGWQRGQE